MKPEEMTAVQERRFRKSVDYFRKNREIYVRRIKKILEEYKNTLIERTEDDTPDLMASCLSVVFPVLMNQISVFVSVI